MIETTLIATTPRFGQEGGSASKAFSSGGAEPTWLAHHG